MEEMKSNKMRIALLELLKSTSKNAFIITGKTLKHLPEYFMSVNIAQGLNNHFKTMKFSMEDKVSLLCRDLDINVGDDSEYFKSCRLNGNVDMVVRHQDNEKIMHLIEFKKGIGEEFIKDVRRLAWFCLKSGSHRKVTRHYIVAVTKRDSEKVNLIKKSITEDLKEYFPKKYKDIVINDEHELLADTDEYALIIEIKSKIQKI